MVDRARSPAHYKAQFVGAYKPGSQFSKATVEQAFILAGGENTTCQHCLDTILAGWEERRSVVLQEIKHFGNKTYHAVAVIDSQAN
jgi:hypothetical protein